MRPRTMLVAGLGAGLAALFLAWRRNPRIGSGLVNERVNPFLVRRGLVGGGRAEIGTLEHFGRRSGTRHLTPVHPEPIEGGFRIILPLGLKSEWARNVQAAGHCRLQLHGVVHELDEPELLVPGTMDDLPFVARMLYDALGFRYLRLHSFSQHPGVLEIDQAPAVPEAGVESEGQTVAPSMEPVGQV